MRLAWRDLSPLGRGENKNPFSRRVPRPRFAYHHNNKALLDSLPSPHDPKRGAERRKAHPNQCPRHTRQATPLDADARGAEARQDAALPSGALAFRRSTAALAKALTPRLSSGPRFLELPGANGRTLPGASAASTSRTGRSAGRVMPKPPGCGLAIPPAGTAPAPPFRHAFRKGVPRLSEICTYVIDPVTVVKRDVPSSRRAVTRNLAAPAGKRHTSRRFASHTSRLIRARPGKVETGFPSGRAMKQGLRAG